MTSLTVPRTAQLRARWHTPQPWVVDVTLAAVALVTGLVSTSSAQSGDIVYHSRDAIGFLLIGLATVPMVLRSRMPIAVLVVTSTSVAILSSAGYNEGALPAWLLVVAGTVGTRRDLRPVAAAAAYVFGLLLMLYAFGHSRDFTLATLVIQVALFAAAFTVGTTIRSRRLQTEALEERTVALEATKAEEAKRAVSEVRLHVAQELHDVLAHTLSVIAVQAGTGAHVLDTQPEEARRALENIAATSRSSLGELRRLLGVLRSDEDAKAYAPAPCLAELDRLVAEVTAAGVPVEMSVNGEPDGVTPGVELAAYRIVQEALTNVLKHAGPATAQVRIDYGSGGIHIEVADDGRGLAARHGTAAGHGLVGMQERVAMYGGTLRTTPGPGGGFRVVADIPPCTENS